MSLDGPLIAPSPVDKLLTKLDDPKVVASLNDLLDHADLLAVLVNGLDELLKRGDVISDSLTQTIAEMRDATTDSDAASALTLVDLPKLARSLTSLSAVLAEAGPVIAALMNSTLADPRAIQVVSVGDQAVTAGAARAREEQTKFSGVFSLLRALRDDDVARGLGFLIHVLREFGKGFSELDLPSPEEVAAGAHTEDDILKAYTRGYGRSARTNGKASRKSSTQA